MRLDNKVILLKYCKYVDNWVYPCMYERAVEKKFFDVDVRN